MFQLCISVILWCERSIQKENLLYKKIKKNLYKAMETKIIIFRKSESYWYAQHTVILWCYAYNYCSFFLKFVSRCEAARFFWNVKTSSPEASAKGFWECIPQSSGRNEQSGNQHQVISFCLVWMFWMKLPLTSSCFVFWKY